jgi:predicted RNase H-like HicB family nuclease
MHEAIEMHVRGMREDKLRVPKSRAFAEYVAVS